MILVQKLERLSEETSTLIKETISLVHLAQQTLEQLRPVLADLPAITASTRRVLASMEAQQSETSPR